MRQVQLPQYHDDPDRRPTLMHGMRKSDAVHLARYLDIGAHQRDFGSGFQDGDGFGCIQRLEWRVSGVFHHVDHAHAVHTIWIDNENDGGNA